MAADTSPEGIAALSDDLHMISCALPDNISVETCSKINRASETILALQSQAAAWKADAERLAGALTDFINGGNRQLALISRKVKSTDPMTLIVTKGQMLAAIDLRAAHDAMMKENGNG